MIRGSDRLSRRLVQDPATTAPAIVAPAEAAGAARAEATGAGCDGPSGGPR
jgi:hypothetical protein